MGIGDHSWIYDGTAIFVDGNANKFYHRLISTKTITEGLTYEWEGIYRWEKDKGISIADDLAEHIESVTLVNVASTGDVTQALDSNKFYKFGSVDSLTLTLNSAPVGMAGYFGKFTTSASWTALSVPSGVTEASGNDTIAASKTYEFNIVDNIIVIKEV